MAAPLLEATDLVAGYGKPVVGPLSFTVEPGEVVGLWGANGSGKSTLLRAIAGTARVFGGRLERRPGLAVAWLAQQPVRLEEMPFSGHDYLRHAGVRDTPPGRLAGWLDRRVDALSGGQFQLLAVWSVVGGPADLVMLDEPTNNLDPEGEAMLAGILKQERGRRTVLLVSHERGFLQEACSRVLEVGS
ncbi:MAG: ATP-binding cassette domain-containing protein [Gammaproteobacteria bacterium]|nr:ATP-binding cassette domain-containing protein [Gammaproteobacteria bacterium]